MGPFCSSFARSLARPPHSETLPLEGSLESWSPGKPNLARTHRPVVMRTEEIPPTFSGTGHTHEDDIRHGGFTAYSVVPARVRLLSAGEEGNGTPGVEFLDMLGMQYSVVLRRRSLAGHGTGMRRLTQPGKMSIRRESSGGRVHKPGMGAK